jgi:excisionase family DNA binding protein
MTENSTGNDQLLKKKDAAFYLGVTSRSVENMMRRGLPYLKLSCRATRFRRSDLDGWLEAQCKVVKMG